VYLGAGIGSDHNLRNTGAIPQIEEDEIAEVAAAVHPSHQDNLGAGVGGTQLSAHMSSFEFA
jgi:hypothetical protein